MEKWGRAKKNLFGWRSFPLSRRNSRPSEVGGNASRRDSIDSRYGEHPILQIFRVLRPPREEEGVCVIQTTAFVLRHATTLRNPGATRSRELLRTQFEHSATPEDNGALRAGSIAKGGGVSKSSGSAVGGLIFDCKRDESIFRIPRCWLPTTPRG